MKIEVQRPFWFEGETQEVNSEIDVPDHFGHELIGLRKAIGVSAATVADKAEDKPARKRKADPVDVAPADVVAPVAAELIAH